MYRKEQTVSVYVYYVIDLFHNLACTYTIITPYLVKISSSSPPFSFSCSIKSFFHGKSEFHLGMILEDDAHTHPACLSYMSRRQGKEAEVEVDVF